MGKAIAQFPEPARCKVDHDRLEERHFVDVARVVGRLCGLPGERRWLGRPPAGQWRLDGDGRTNTQLDGEVSEAKS